MNCIFLSPHFPPQYHRFCRQLKLAGANALGIGDAPYDTLAPEVREALSEYYRVERMDDYDQLLRACGHFTHKYGKIDRIDSLNESWLGIEARLRDDFNVFGVRTADIGTIRRKSEMKEKFREAGVAVAPGRVVHTLSEARALIGETGYDPAYGARPLRRLIQTAIGDPLARMLIAGEVDDGGQVTVDKGPDGLTLTV